MAENKVKSANNLASPASAAATYSSSSSSTSSSTNSTPLLLKSNNVNVEEDRDSNDVDKAMEETFSNGNGHSNHATSSLNFSGRKQGVITVAGALSNAEGPSHDVDDLIMLHNLSEDGIVDALSSRSKQDKIYTYIGNVVISVNPFKTLNIYSKEDVIAYRDAYVVSNKPPHIYTLANQAYNSLLRTFKNQCILITGESGAGKTEASKIIMQFVAVVSDSRQQQLLKKQQELDARQSQQLDRQKQASQQSAASRQPLARGASSAGLMSDLHTTAQVKNQLLESNPVMEAFGNAKTLRNDNSSRFGKYMEIEFNVRGDPKGARIQTYLLEKSRVVRQQKNERNFHIFYQLLAGLESSTLSELLLTRDPSRYHYLNQSDCTKLDHSDDAADFRATTHGMEVVGFSKEELKEIWQLLASILLLGNVEFISGKKVGGDGDSSKTEGDRERGVFASSFQSNFREQEKLAKDKDKDSRPVLKNEEAFGLACKVLGISEKNLLQAFTFRTMTVEGKGNQENYKIQLSPAESNDTRDALSKNLYQRLFTWLVSRINANMEWKSDRVLEGRKLVISLLDIYGFEIFQTNGFDQFCINYCNERLQQLAIHLTLESEQQEYTDEEIPWVHIEYFNNQAICALIEKKPVGIITILDEECLLPEKTHITFVRKLNENCSSHPHFVPQKLVASHGDAEFTLKHYAGDVKYLANDFLKKNKDLLYNDLLDVMKNHSSSAVIKKLFVDTAYLHEATADSSGLMKENSVNEKSEPSSTASSRDGSPAAKMASSKLVFEQQQSQQELNSPNSRAKSSPVRQTSLGTGVSKAAQLFGGGAGARRRPVTLATQFRTQVTNLMNTLSESTPHYVRCIKPNDKKSAGIIDPAIVRNQVRYLGLLENVKVRRAGYCFRQSYAAFLSRYKMACPETWPLYIPGGLPPRPSNLSPRDFHADDKRRSVALHQLISSKKTTQEQMDKEAVKILLNHLGVTGTECEFGKTKIFIKEPVTLFALEKIREMYLPSMVCIIQNAWRAAAARLWLKRTKAAIVMQSAWRMYHAHKAYKRLRAAITLQAAVRCWRQRTWYKRYRAATHIAAMFRGYRVRREYTKFKRIRLLQSLWRRHHDRVQFLVLRKRFRAAVLIQKHVRGYMVRKNLFKIRAASTIQRHVRRWLLRRALAATYIKKMWRMHRARKNFLRHRRATMVVQAIYRLYRARKAATTVAKIWRGFAVRSRVARQKSAINKIKRYWQRRKLIKYFEILQKSFNASNPRTPLPPVPATLKKMSSAFNLESRWKNATASKFVSSLSTQRIEVLMRKAMASDMFLGKKENYSLSVRHAFAGDYLKLDDPLNKSAKGWRKAAFGSILEQNMINTEVVFADNANKLNSKFSLDPASIILTKDCIYRLDRKSFKVKAKFRIADIRHVYISPFADDYLILASNDYMIIEIKRYVEFLTTLHELYRKISKQALQVNFGTRFDLSSQTNKLSVSFMPGDKFKDSKINILEKKTSVAIMCPVCASVSSFNLFLANATSDEHAGTLASSSSTMSNS